MNQRILLAAGLALSFSATLGATEASAQTTGGAERVAQVVTVRPEVATLRKLQKPVTVAFADNKLEDVLKFIADATGADLEIMWADDRESDGLNKETTITLDAKSIPAITLLERVLDKAYAADSSSEGGNTWQMTTLGAVQVGPKTRLNKFRRLEVYPIDDLLLEIPRFDEAPEFNLQTVLQGAQGGGGQSPFQDQGGQEEDDRPTREQKTQDLIEVITTLVEPEQWVDNSGSGGTIRAFQGSLLINAPDYMHRELAGYPYWPSRASSGGGKTRRWVGMSGETSSSAINGLNNVPITEPK